ncbi:glycerophosphodiester phosphodiesterase family protein [Devosia sp. YR412]|uniref:glycerophosphodiester phosphodiesterase family protein n=1 Tax=Devosia sp. YR412 TaxID=1881030 RepID=UPI001FCDAC52|nr:glycerophosphodiester phosphodiesterase family protein [Devosia sp. YR412]
MNYKDFMASPKRDCAIIVHRGIWRDAPENSLLAIERAIAGGFDVVEIDIRKSADGEFVLLHDDTLKRMAGLAAAPEQMSAAELAQVPLRNRNGAPRMA